MTLDSILADVRKVAGVLDPILAFVAVAQKATRVGGVTAERALSAIAAAVDTLEEVAAGRVAAEQASERIRGLLPAIEEHNATADAALEARFVKQ